MMFTPSTPVACRFSCPGSFTKQATFSVSSRRRRLPEKITKRLIVPYLVFSLVGVVAYGALLFSRGELTYKYLLSPIFWILYQGTVEGNMALWFLPSLFTAKMLYNRVCHWPKTAAWLASLSILALALSSYYLPEDIHRVIPLYCYNIPLGFVFLWIGNKIRRYLSRPLEIAIVLIYIAILIFVPTMVDMRMAELMEGYWLMYIPSAAAGIITINFLCNKLLDFPNIFSYIGRNSMPYYVMHWIVLVMVRMFIPNGSPANHYYACIAIASCVVILPAATILIRKFGYQSVFGE